MLLLCGKGHSYWIGFVGIWQMIQNIPQFEIVDDYSFDYIVDYLDIRKNNFSRNFVKTYVSYFPSVFMNCHVLHIHFSSSKVLCCKDDICVRSGKFKSMSGRLNEKLLNFVSFRNYFSRRIHNVICILRFFYGWASFIRDCF